MLRGFLGMLVGMGCTPEATTSPGAAARETPAPPRVVDHSIRCDVDHAVWEIEILTDAWASEAKIHWTVDGTYAETKKISSVAAAEDGSWDHLQASFDVVDDWRKASAKTTAFGCSEDVASLLIVFDLGGNPSDCVDEGGNAGLWSSLGLTPCDGNETTL